MYTWVCGEGCTVAAGDTKKLIITKGKERPQKAGCILVHPVSLGSLQRAAILERGGEGMVLWRRFQKVGSLLHA